MVSFMKASELETEEIRWLWACRIPIGGLTIFDGPPGLGKSTVLSDLAARISTGSSLPDGTLCEQGSVIWVSAEEDPESVILPRFEAAGGDREQLIISTDLRIPSEIQQLVNVANENDTRLLIIDPLSGHVEKSTTSEQAMRQSLIPLQVAARENGFSVIAVRHHTKSTRSGVSMYAGLGSVGIPAVSRTALTIGRSPDGSGECILAWSKASNSVVPQSLRFEIVSNDRSPSINWLGSSEFGSEDLIGASPRPTPKLNAAEDLLKRELANGPMPQQQLIAAASRQGISKRTLERAKANVGIIPIRAEYQGQVSWAVGYNKLHHQR